MSSSPLPARKSSAPPPKGSVLALVKGATSDCAIEFFAPGDSSVEDALATALRVQSPNPSVQRTQLDLRNQSTRPPSFIVVGGKSELSVAGVTQLREIARPVRRRSADGSFLQFEVVCIEVKGYADFGA